jgi:uncharacterized protein YdhG (YjbR/CyaY superfamily)
MTSKAPDVDTYIADVPADRRAAIEKLRSLCRRHLKGYDESMQYGLPTYRRGGVPEVAFASQKQYIALYVMKKDVLDEFRSALGASSIGKGCVRFNKPEMIDFAVIDRLLRRNAQSAAANC